MSKELHLAGATVIKQYNANNPRAEENREMWQLYQECLSDLRIKEDSKAEMQKSEYKKIAQACKDKIRTNCNNRKVGEHGGTKRKVNFTPKEKGDLQKQTC